MNIYSIYKITNTINDKVYIGKSQSKNCVDRWNAHIRSIQTAKRTVLIKAFIKYGIDAFKFEIIFQTFDNDKKYLSDLERLFISEYNSFVNSPDSRGYNMTLGGEGGNGYSNKGKPKSEETKQKLREANLGKKASEETRRKLSIISSNRIYPDDFREKMRNIALSLPDVQCQWCGKFDKARFIARYHNDNCKHNPDNVILP